MAGEGRQSLPGGTGENHEFRSQVSQSTDSHANTVPPEYGAVVPTADRCSVLRYFKGSHPLRRSLYHAGRNRRFFVVVFRRSACVCTLDLLPQKISIKCTHFCHLLQYYAEGAHLKRVITVFRLSKCAAAFLPTMKLFGRP